MQPHLFCALSGHGFGHVTQAGPVLNQLCRMRPDLKLTVASSAPPEQLRARIHHPFDLIEEAYDFGMVMHNALTVKREESYAAYQAFHANYADRRNALAAHLAQLQPDLVFADVPYLAIDAAHVAGIPSVALCSLNWADVFDYYFAGWPGAEAIHAEILAAYRRADIFLQPAPSMPMPALANTRAIGPIAEIGRNRRAEINQRLQLRGDERLVLLGLGGLQFHFNVRDWPRDESVRYLVARRTRLLDHPQVIPFDDLDMPFYDIMASCDGLVTKPGYGTFAEIVCNGVAALFAPREDWPESEVLVTWLKEYGRAEELDPEKLVTGDFLKDLDAIVQQPRPVCPAPTGIFEAAECLAGYLD